MIERLQAVLRASGVDLTPAEVAEALWLALRVDLAGRPPPVPPTPEPGPVAEPPPPADRVELRLPPGPTPPPAAESTVETRAGTVTFDGVPGRPLRLATAEALPHSGRTMHALRPLKRRLPSARRVVIDEEATVRQIAERRLWTPVWRPALERWLHLTLVLDDTALDGVWHRLGEEVRILLERLGAFRTMRVLTLGGAGERSLSRLADRPGDHLVLVLSDCVGTPWTDGRMSALLARWAARAPVAILQPLPERLWSRTGLSPRAGRLFAPRAGAAASAYTFVSRLRRRRLPEDAVAVPILEIDPRWLGSWARLVAGRAPGGIDAVVTLAGVPLRASRAVTTEVVSAARRVRHFLDGASEPARDLAGNLAVAQPLNLAVMRLLQAVTVPGSRPAHLAEVLYGGLLQPLESSSLTADEQHFEFLPGVRGTLRDLPGAADPELVFGLVSDYLERHPERSGALFTALATMPVDGPGVPSAADPFAGISADVLRRFIGGTGGGGPAVRRIRERLTVLHLRSPVASVDLPVGVSPDLVVVTGGVARRATTAEYRTAFAELEELRTTLGLPLGRLVVTPGLTDVNPDRSRAYFLEQDAEGREPVSPYWPKWIPFAGLTARLPGGTGFQPHQPFQLYAIPALRTVVAALNSTVPVSHLPGEQAGGLGEAQVTWFADRLRDYEDRGWLRVGVVHHADLAEVARLAPHLDLVLDGQGGGVRELGLTGVPAVGARGVVELRPGKLLADGVSHAYGDHWWLAEDGPPPLPRAADDPAHPDRTDLLAEVARAYRARHPGAPMVERHWLDQQAGYLVISPAEERHCVGVLDGPPSAELVERFLDQVVWRERPGRDATLVCRSAPEPELRRWALSRGVRLADFADFQLGDDVLEFARRQAERLAEDPPHPPGDAGMVDALRDLVAEPGGRLIGVTGASGAGKTSLLRELARRMYADHDPVVPIMINLAQHDWRAPLEQVVVVQLVRGGIRELDAGHIRYLLAEGRFVLLCDGLDRLGAPERAAETLAQRRRAGNASMVLVSRHPGRLEPVADRIVARPA